ncbi:MAG: PAS domain-containing protein [Proteobacteria bacterium]|nr:PAS domain-containing protein [Pseudomonadota bacterium]
MGTLPIAAAASAVTLLVGVVLGRFLRSGGALTADLGAVLSGVPDAAVMLDSEGRLVGNNDAAVELMGPLLEAPNGIIGREDLIPRGILLESIEAARLSRVSGQVWAGRVNYRPPGGGKSRVLDVRVVPAQGDSTLVTARDSTMDQEREKKFRWEVDRQAPALKGMEWQLEERTAELARLSEQYFQLFDTAPAFYLHLDDHLRIVVINTSGADSLGHEPKDLIGRPVWEIFDPDDRARVKEHLGKPEGLDPHNTEEFSLMGGNDKVIPVLLSATQVPDPTGRERPGIRLTLVDVSTIKEHQTLLRRISAELEERNAVLELKNEEIARADRLKSEFLNNVSHELRTPLHAMIGYAELIHSGGYGPTTDLQRHGAAGVLKRGEDLLQLINNLLDLSRIEAGRVDVQISAFDPAAVAAKPLETTRMLVRKKSGLKVRLINDDAPRLVTGDEDMYTRILMNLLGNASRFTETGTIAVSVCREGSTFVTAVSDTGIGMDEKALQFIFDEFRQVDGSTTRKYGGSGLGLAICKKLCDLMGGDISVTSRVGQGTTFYVKLPIHGEEVIARSNARDWTQHETTISR